LARNQTDTPAAGIGQLETAQRVTDVLLAETVRDSDDNCALGLGSERRYFDARA
jgi:hypothetical protein